MKRRLLKLAVFLALGAIVNVAVAWGCAAYGPFGKSYSRNVLKNDDVGSWWQSEFPFEGAAIPLNDSESSVESPEPEVPGTMVQPEWKPNAVQSGGIGLDFVMASGRCMLDQRAAWASAMQVRSGWPLRSMVMSRWRVRGEPAENAIIINGMLVHPRPAAWSQPEFTFLMGDRYLPLQPMWGGFILNSLFYAVVLWPLFACPFAMRRSRRRRRGLCVKCAYDLRGCGDDSSHCPECGALISPRSPTHQ